MTKPTRQRKTPQQRAQEALGVATRAVERLATTQERLEAELQTVSAELSVAVRRRDFLAQHPDLADPAQMTLDTDGDES